VRRLARRTPFALPSSELRSAIRFRAGFTSPDSLGTLPAQRFVNHAARIVAHIPTRHEVANDAAAIEQERVASDHRWKDL
jgi:hypothetical protein